MHSQVSRYNVGQVFALGPEVFDHPRPDLLKRSLSNKVRTIAKILSRSAAILIAFSCAIPLSTSF